MSTTSDWGQLQNTRSEKFLRPLSALRTVSHLCNQLLAQEARDSNFHTLIAVDMDVVHMAAFPCENLALGSVFHAWAPLREASLAMSKAIGEQDNKGRNEVLNLIFRDSELRIPLLTTIALSSFIFDRRSRTEAFECYVVLPPLKPEWDKGLVRARTDASNFSNSLRKRVDVAEIRSIVDHALSEGFDVAETLIDELPETASALFPAQLSPDHALASFLKWGLGGAVKPYERLVGLPKFSTLVPKRAAQGGFDEWQKLLEVDFESSAGLSQLSTHQMGRALGKHRQRIDADAQVLSVLQSVRDRPPLIELASQGRKPLRIILLTASARMWRVARAGGIAESCLRSPIAYLSDGGFYDWAFNGTPHAQDEQGQLLDRLREGLLSQWLELLTKNLEATGDNSAEKHQGFVDDWERLMSHLSTSLSLDSPASGLKRALDLVLKERSASPDAIAALLQHKIVEITQRLTHSASGVGLTHFSGSLITLRNLPPIDLRPYQQAQSLLVRVATEDLGVEKNRLDLLEEIMGLSAGQPETSTGPTASSYFQSILISLLWFRLHQWSISNDVAGQAVSYVLQGKALRPGDSETVAPATPGDLRGDEALYLACVTGRLCAANAADLEIPRLALDYALSISEGMSESSNVVLRLQSEKATFEIADLLFSSLSPMHGQMAQLSALRTQKALANAMSTLSSSTWKQVREAVRSQSAGSEKTASHDTYMQSYALQQMYCSVGMLYMMCASILIADSVKSAVAEFVEEFVQLSAAWKQAKPGSFELVDSNIAKSIRDLASWQLLMDGISKQSQSNELDPQKYCLELEQAAKSEGIAPLDRVRLQWLSGVHSRATANRNRE